MHWAGHTHGSLIARCIAFITRPWMGYWYIIHKRTYNCIFFFFFLLFSATFNAAPKQNGLHLTKCNHEVMHLVAIFYPFTNSDYKRKDQPCLKANARLQGENIPSSRAAIFYSIWRGLLFINKWQASADKYHFLKQNESSLVHLFTHRHAILKISPKWHYSGDWNHYFIEQKIAIEFGAE